MYTIHDSRDIGCPVRGIAYDPNEAHAKGSRMGIPERCRLILSDSLKTVAGELFPVVALPRNPNAQSNKIHPIRDRK